MDFAVCGEASGQTRGDTRDIGHLPHTAREKKRFLHIKKPSTEIMDSRDFKLGQVLNKQGKKKTLDENYFTI